MALAVAGVLAVGAGAVAATGIGLRHDGGDGGSARSALPPASAKVAKQTLVDKQAKTGKLGYGDTTALNGRLQGTVTSIQAPGSVVDRGKVLYRVDDSPVVLMYGTLPAYRELKPDTQGADVKQFEQNLWDLGYRGFTVDDKYTDATATAVKKWQADLGVTKTGSVELGRVAYAPDTIRVDSDKLLLGDAAQPGAAVLTYTGTTRVVSVELEMSEARLAKTDTPVSLQLPDGKSTDGKVVKTVTTVDPGEGKDATPKTKVKVTVAVDDPKALEGFDAASVDVGFTASRRENVLTVPVAALLALAEGGYGVQVVEGTGTRIVAVHTGMFANGRVEVTGDGLTDGTTVGMPS
ncbi:peptidoglycan-binding protein [Yinghuangia seranimata]|uniref:peptidoglycan-binding protein n=1 Tax=Yinghuangia seranimata TaxID=408067 RepID=UPI00248CB36E|nr:peptidoglycan-binding domain-containing protein [Yinghuangia seranimata]MDI2131997.1 peptidoglycan-binding domain-containing protein [Yinghuangia seranimata]